MKHWHWLQTEESRGIGSPNVLVTGRTKVQGKVFNKKLNCHTERPRVLRITEYFAKSFKVTQGHSQWHHSIDRIRVPWRSIVTIAMFCIISNIKRDIGRKSRFFILSAFDAPVRGPRRNTAIRFGAAKLKWCGYQTVKKVWEYVYSFRYNTRTWRTAGRTDTPPDGIGHAYTIGHRAAKIRLILWFLGFWHWPKTKKVNKWRTIILLTFVVNTNHAI